MTLNPVSVAVMCEMGKATALIHRADTYPMTNCTGITNASELSAALQAEGNLGAALAVWDAVQTPIGQHSRR